MAAGSENILATFDPSSMAKLARATTWVNGMSRRRPLLLLSGAGPSRFRAGLPPRGLLGWTSAPGLPKATPHVPFPIRHHSNGIASFVEPPDYLTEGELAIYNKLKSELTPTKLEVQDVSGGCGSMYALDITSPKFEGLSIIKQHRLVNEILGEEIKQWHGVQLRTRAP